MDHLLLHGWCHRDIKAENILINPDTLQIKLIDFGLTAQISSMSTEFEYAGTPLYMAPSVLRLNKGPSKSDPVLSDVWSAGIVLWQLLRGEHPFAFVKSFDELMEVHENLFKRFNFLDVPPTVRALLTGLLQYEEEKRASLDLALAYVQRFSPSCSPRAQRRRSSPAVPSVSKPRVSFEKITVKPSARRMRSTSCCSSSACAPPTVASSVDVDEPSEAPL